MAIIMLGVPSGGLASHPGRGGNIPSHLMLLKLELSAGLIGHLDHKLTHFYYSISPKGKFKMEIKATGKNWNKLEKVTLDKWL